MKSSNLFTYILYVLLAALILLAGKMVLDKRAEKQRSLSTDSPQLKNQPSVPAPTGNESVKPSHSDAPINQIPDEKKPTDNKSSNEKKDSEQSQKSKKEATSKNTQEGKSPTNQPNVLTAKGGAPSSPTAKKLSQPSKGRYLVVVGTFTVRENALTEMENMINAGYPNAEVIKYKEDMWRVIAVRCKTPEDASQQEGHLERHGFDAIVVDSYKK